MDHREAAHNLALETLRNCPEGMTDQDQFAEVCTAIGVDFPELPIEEVLALSQAAITNERGKH